MRVLAAMVGLAGCGDDDPAGDDGGTTDSSVNGACGEIDHIAGLAIAGRVRDEDQNWVAGVEVAFEERNWEPGIRGTGITDADGYYEIHAADLVVGCWGVGVSYWLTGVKDELTGEQPMNPYIIEAVETGATSITTGDIPMILRAP